VHQFSMPGGEEAHVSISLARLWAYSRYARLRQRAENLRLRIARKVT